MKKSILFLLPLLLLSSCQNVDTISSSSIDNETTSSSSKNDEPISSNSNVSPSTSTTITPSTIVVTPSTNTITPFTPNQTSSSSSSEDDEITYNPDGSQHLPVPQEHVEETWGTQEVKYSFLESFPGGFQYIYGHKILNQPNFYQDDTKGWKVTIPNSLAQMGVQTPLFESNLKIEIRLYLTGIYNSSNKVDQDQPWVRVYGFNKEGTLTQIKEVECPSNFYNYKNSSNPINFYMSGEDVDYLEIRFTAPPYKGSQCYNFGIKEIGFKTFPYAYVEK